MLSGVRELLSAGRNDEAASLAGRRETREIRDAALHLQWSEVFEEMGLIDELIMELNLAVRDDPENRDAHVRLAEIYLDQGQPLRAARTWEALAHRCPMAPDLYRQWGAALEGAGEFEKARAAYAEGLEKTDDATLKGLLKNLDFLAETGQAPAAGGETAAEESPRLLPQAHHLVAFLTLFGGREGVYARQWMSPTGESGYTPVEEPLTPKVAEHHLLGNFTIGVYPVRLDNTVNFIAFDIDIAKFAVRETIANKRRWDAVMVRTQETACRIVDLGAAWEVPVHLEDSGFKGRHAWIFLETPVPAGVAKKFGDLIAAALAPLPREITVEVFPRQGSVARGGLGNLIKLPLGIHRRTGQRSRIILPDGTDHPDPLSFLLNARKTTRRAVYAFIQQARQRQAAAAAAAPMIGAASGTIAGVHGGPGAGAYFAPGAGAYAGDAAGDAAGVLRGVLRGAPAAFAGREGPDNCGADGLTARPPLAPPDGGGAPPPWEAESWLGRGRGAAGRDAATAGLGGMRPLSPERYYQPPPLPEEYHPDQDHALQTLLSRCDVLRALVEQVHRTGRLSHEETQVLIHTVGHLDHGPEAVNDLFERAWQADPALFLKSRHRGNPMSCPKIRARIPAITAAVGCNCVFDLGTNLYPSPLIHVRAVEAVAATAGRRSLPAAAVDSLEFQNFLQDYLKLRKQLRESQALLARYEERLAGFFDETGVESVHTALGDLRREKKEGEGEGPAFVLEL